MRSTWLGLVALAWGCIDGAHHTEDEGCADIGDCSDEYECAGPNDFRGCGIGPAENCADSDGCGTGQACHAVYDSCSEDGIGSQCDLACDDATSPCPADFACVAGACVAVLCTDGFVCPQHEVCDPAAIPAGAPAYDRHHGCVDVDCTADADCATGACVNAICQDGPGSCEEVFAVP